MIALADAVLDPGSEDGVAIMPGPGKQAHRGIGESLPGFAP